MSLKNFPFYNRILLWLLFPVVVVGILGSTLLVTELSAPMKSFLVGQFDANLRLASIMGLQTCEESFNYLLDLRLEKNAEMNQVLQTEAIAKIKSISDQFPYIHLLVLKSGQSIVSCSMAESPDRWTNPPLKDLDDSALAFDVDGKIVRSHVQFFPFWDWHIISFVFAQDYERPVRMAYKVTYLSAFGVLLAVVVTLLIVFRLFINKPLNQLVNATDGVAEGRFFKINRINRNEFGRLMVSFNGMVESLDKEKAEVRHLLHQLRESEALFRSQFEYGNIGIGIANADGGWIRVNERFCHVLGYNEEKLLKKKMERNILSAGFGGRKS